jgi:hypothetical protein
MASFLLETAVSYRKVPSGTTFFEKNAKKCKKMQKNGTLQRFLNPKLASGTKKMQKNDVFLKFHGHSNGGILGPHFPEISRNLAPSAPFEICWETGKNSLNVQVRAI